MKRIINVLIALFLVLTVTGCTKKVDPQKNEGNKEFEELLYKWFVEDAGEDYLNLHYTLTDPSKYGITVPKPTLGEFSEEDEEENERELKERLETLRSYDASTFNDEQLIAYECLMFDYETLEKYYELEELYDFPFTPSSGLNNNLPTNLTEFDYRKKQDFDDFIDLVLDSGRYIDECLDYLKELNEEDIYQNDNVIDEIIESCERFASKKEDNEIIVIFNKAVDNFGLENAEDYKKRLADAVLNELIPGYERIIAYYKSIYGKSKNELGLRFYDHGREYYEIIFRDRLGTDEKVFDVETKLKAEITRTVNNIIDLSDRNPKAYRQYMNDSYDFGYKDPYEILEFIKTKMPESYPDIPKVEYSVNYLDESVATDGIVAYYLLSTIDDVTKNVIKCNKKYTEEDPNYLCTTLSHEGYPGHLYQHTYYFSREETLPIRSLFSYTGYAEGWAMYTEYDSTSYFTDEDLAAVLNLYEQLNYYLYGYLDIMFNYEGWTIEKAANFLGNFFNSATDIAESIKDVVVGDPTTYLSYSYGYFVMKDMREDAQADLGKKFNLKEFNKVILETGPSPFPVLKEQIQKYVDSHK